MAKLSIRVLLCLLLASVTHAATGAPPLPDPPPFAQVSKLSRQDPVFKVDTFPWDQDGKAELYEQPSFVVGNKAVCVRKINGRGRPDDKSITVYIDNKEVARLVWWGAFKSDVPGNFGYPFKDIENDPATLTIDKDKSTVTYRKPYRTPDGKRAVFWYALRALKDSKVEVSWDLGVSQEAFEHSGTPFGVSPWFSMSSCYRDHTMSFGGKPFTPAAREKLLDKKTVSTPVTGDLVFAADEPAQGFSIEFGDMKGEIQEAYGNDQYGFTCRSSFPKSQPGGKIVIDLGEAGLRAEDAPPPVGGIDFWKLDGLHVPLSPVRNLMPNPSFEQGMRYWRWIEGGAYYDPADQLRYDIVPQGLFGKQALIMRSTQPRSPGLLSFPLSLDKDQTYTLSFHAKADKPCGLTVGVKSAARGGKFNVSKSGPFGDTGTPEARFTVSNEWKRYSRTFTADAAGIQILLSGRENLLLDGLQLEKGAVATDFVAVPIDGAFTTGRSDNDLVKGEPLDTGFTFVGQPGTTGEVLISVKNAFRETVAAATLKVAIPDDGVQRVGWPLDPGTIGEGIFVVRAEYRVKGVEPYVDYHRFSVMTPLANTHDTKDVFGTILHIARIGRGEDLARKLMEWGYGSTSWGAPADGLRAPLEKKYRIVNYVGSAMPFHTGDADILKTYKTWTAVTPELEQRIEAAAYEKVKQYDPGQYNTWTFGNEEESSYLPGHGMFDEYFKAQSACARGIKRANPKALVTPTSGTSGYNRLRGYDAIEGYLRAAKEHGFTYDAVSVHPYGNIDKGTLGANDLDEETARLIEQMNRYGYGKETPIYYTEMFNVPETYIPSWGAGGSYDEYQAGKPTYDFGNREFIHASSLARIWIIMLKYWPQVRSGNVWVHAPFMDYRLTPLLMCKVSNTLGHHLPYVEYQADIKPAAGIRGYAFRLKDGSGIAPIWCVDHDVENGLRRGPVIQVKFGQDVEMVDLMGNARSAKPDGDGITAIQLTPAPLLIKGKDAALLAKAMQNAETDDSRSALQVSMRPTPDGNVAAVVKNLTGRRQRGVLGVGDKALEYSIEPEAEQVVHVPGEKPSIEFGKMYRWNRSLKVQPSKGAGMDQVWNMDYFYVPKTSGMPDWDKIPAIPITNRYLSSSYKDQTPAGDQSAVFKVAWDNENIYLRVEANDDHFLTFPELWKRGIADKGLYVHDGCLEVYFDTGANGRTNHEKTYDQDDYRYDFSIGKSGTSGPGMVYRLREVYHQLADGINMPTKEEAAQRITCDFKVTEKGYAYTITFGQRYLEPLMLRKGFTSGFALYLHDTDNPKGIGCPKGLSLATEMGSHCDYKPHLWPLMILAE